MELELMRSLMTVIAFATFVGIVVWAWSGRKRGDFELAARSVLVDDEAVAQAANTANVGRNVQGSVNIRGGGNE